MIGYKGYYIKSHSRFPGSYELAIQGQGGRIPNKMKGMFTSVGEAKSVIDSYIAKRTTIKEKTNASKARAKSGS